MMTHVSLAYSPQAKHVAVIGGGDGGVVFQALKHPNVETVTLIEIDPEVIKVARKHFKNTSGSFDDPRVTIINRDGAKWVEEQCASDRVYEALIIDSTDTGIASPLFSDEFYDSVNRCVLKHQGVESHGRRSFTVTMS